MIVGTSKAQQLVHTFTNKCDCLVDEVNYITALTDYTTYLESKLNLA